MSHDAVLQLRRAAHVRSKPSHLLSVRLPTPAREACLLPLEDCTSANHRAECQGKVSGGRSLREVTATGLLIFCPLVQCVIVHICLWFSRCIMGYMGVSINLKKLLMSGSIGMKWLIALINQRYWSDCGPLRALLLLDQYRQKSRLFRSPVLLVSLGDDFRYVESSEWDAQFNNYQKLFDYFDQHPELHIKVRHLWEGGAEGERQDTFEEVGLEGGYWVFDQFSIFSILDF